ncbi:MAG: hypothetical protein LBL74_07485 [Bacteroidales bacterium]|jgi:hypothetical protein|nr:hypothetical protein [Bacteroidales bacterium]
MKNQFNIANAYKNLAKGCFIFTKRRLGKIKRCFIRTKQPFIKVLSVRHAPTRTFAKTE